MPAIIRAMKLRELLEQKAGIHSSRALQEAIGGSIAQASNLWNGHDTIGAMLMVRILRAFPSISMEELSQVDEAAKSLKPPKSHGRPKNHPNDAAIP